MRKPRAVVAGGAGFLGSHLCDRLVADGFSVLCIDNFATGICGNLDGLSREIDFNVFEWDVTQPFTIPGVIDLVFNLASPASPRAYENLPLETLMAGSFGSFHLLELALEKNSRYVFASTSEVYGDPAVHPQPEAYWGNVNPVGPRAVYDESKRYAEALVMAYRRMHLVNAAIVRIFNTYGPRMRFDDGRVVPTFVGQALAGEPLTVKEPGTQTRSLCYVDDLIEGLIRVSRGAVSGPINLGNSHEVTMMELASLIIKLCEANSAIKLVAGQLDDPKRRCPNTKLAQTVLDWSPKVDLRCGLTWTIDWFRAEPAV